MTYYKEAAESMAVHIQGILSQLAPDTGGRYKALTAAEVETLYLFSAIFVKVQPAKGVFDQLKRIKDE